jgi:hypothetical protein
MIHATRSKVRLLAQRVLLIRKPPGVHRGLACLARFAELDIHVTEAARQRSVWQETTALPGPLHVQIVGLTPNTAVLVPRVAAYVQVDLTRRDKQ